MARFYGGTRGARGEATRLGTAQSGQTAFARGWKIGGKVEMCDVNGVDVVHLTVTSGSNGSANTVELGAFVIGPEGEIIPYEPEKEKRSA